MDEAAAKQIAGKARPGNAVPTGHALRGAERRIIEISDGAGGSGPLVRDVRAWIVRFAAGVAWVELAIDEATGNVVRVQRSRT